MADTRLKVGDLVYYVASIIDAVGRPIFELVTRKVIAVDDDLFEVERAPEDADRSCWFSYAELDDFVFTSREAALVGFKEGIEETRRHARRDLALADYALAWLDTQPVSPS